MAWIETHSDIWAHHKTRTLSKEAGITKVQAVGHLLSLWHFILENAWRDADLEAWGDDGIEEAARWAGEPGKLVASLRTSGFMDGFVAHGWLERAGTLVYDRLRKEKQKRDNVKRVVPGTVQTDSGKFREIPGTVPATQPNPTIPNPTIPTEPYSVKDFKQFWKAYPKHEGMGAAEKAWAELSPPLEEVLRALEWQKEQWSGRKSEHIMAPANWLKAKRWLDEKKVEAAVTEFQKTHYGRTEQEWAAMADEHRQMVIGDYQNAQRRKQGVK